ncbi:MAG: NfeD family protein [Planctomycetota bacterium]
MPDAGILATLLLLVGLFLLGLEFFIPSLGMILVLAVISLVVSFWSAVQAWWGTDPTFFRTYVIALIFGIPSSLAAAFLVLHKTSAGNRLVLQPPAPEPLVRPEELSLIGKVGKAANLMTPGGLVVVDGQRLHAESQGMLVEPGTPVIVIGTVSNRVVIRPLRPEELETAPDSPAAPPAEVARPSPTENAQPLDFDLPPG